MDDWRWNKVLWASNDCTGRFKGYPRTHTVEVIVMRLRRKARPFARAK